MTKEDKDLVLRDLCARLPYKVIVDYSYNAFDVHKGHYIKHGSKCILNCYLLDTFLSPRQNEKGEYIKPYLRPLSSMTEDELQRYHELCDVDEAVGVGSSIEIIAAHDTPESLDYLNSIHVDYRGLIPKGRAIEVTEDNNPYKD